MTLSRNPRILIVQIVFVANGESQQHFKDIAQHQAFKNALLSAISVKILNTWRMELPISY